MEQLIEERLQLGAAESQGLVLTEEQIAAGEDEFAARANLDRETFIKALAEGGVEEQTFRDFVSAGLLWREVVRTRFAGRVTVTDADIDQALSASAPRPTAVRLLFSEIILPANTPAAKATAQRRAAEISQYTTPEQFSRAARAFSASPSRARGGRLDWVEVANMQPGLAQVLLALAPGQVSKPLPIPNGIALFQLRAVEDGIAPPPSPLTVEYALYQIPGGRSPAALAEAAKLKANADTCNDLYEANRKRGTPEALEVTTAEMSEVPADIALELAKLDPGEFSDALTRGGNLALLMLCSRQVPLPEDVSREDIRKRLLDQRVQSLAKGYLEELRADAIIRKP
nr:peptidylprolyl isomerase [Frigidibacter sp. ROC022]